MAFEPQKGGRRRPCRRIAPAVALGGGRRSQGLDGDDYLKEVEAK